MGLFGLFGSGDLVVRDQSTGESRSFDTSKSGYAAAQEFRERILEKGHAVGDDNTGSLGKIDDYLGPPKAGRSGWF